MVVFGPFVNGVGLENRSAARALDFRLLRPRLPGPEWAPSLSTGLDFKMTWRRPGMASDGATSASQ